MSEKVVHTDSFTKLVTISLKRKLPKCSVNQSVLITNHRKWLKSNTFKHFEPKYIHE